MQRDSKLARRYGQALRDFAIEQNELDAVAADMELISETCKQSRDLVVMLRSPVIKVDKKVSVLNKAFGGKIGSISLNFIGIIAKRDREDVIPEIAAAFVNLYKEHQGIVSAEVISAVPLDDELRSKVNTFVKRFSDKVELKEVVDEDIIGGIIIRVGDRQYDDSILKRINELKREFSKNPYISQL